MFTLPENMADHPRFGKSPRVTNFAPNGNLEGLLPGWKYAEEIIFNNTGVLADLRRQHGSAIPVYVYYDVLKKCEDCERPYIFFAEEQRFWFEQLGLANDADCVRCVECRKKHGGEEKIHRDYQHLLALEGKEWQDYLELTRVALDLLALRKFKSTGRIHQFFDRIPETQHHHLRYRQTEQRLMELERELDNELEIAYEQSFSANASLDDEEHEVAA